MTLQTTDYVASCPTLSSRSHFLLALDCSLWTPWQPSSIGQLIPVSSAAPFPGSCSLFKLAHRVPLLKTKSKKRNCHSVLGVPVATFLSLTFLSDSSILKVLCLLFSPLPQLFVILPPTRVCGVCLLPFHGNFLLDKSNGKLCVLTSTQRCLTLLSFGGPPTYLRAPSASSLCLAFI